MLITLHLAAVTGVDGICFVAAEPTTELLSFRLSEYVRMRAPHMLWPEDARCVDRALAAGLGDVAVETYFAAVGRRWDEESLFRASVQVTVAGASESATISAQ